MTIMLVRDSGRGYYRYRFKEFPKTFSSLSELAKFLSDNKNIYLAPKQLFGKQLSRKPLSGKQLSCKELSILCKKLQSLRNKKG